MPAQLTDEGWRQVRAGVSLIAWSRLASWNPRKLRFVAVNEAEFKTSAVRVHGEFGRLICWITFSVGAEYIAKGACLLKGLDVSERIKVIRLPRGHENIEAWVQLVNADDPSIKEQDVKFGTLGKVPVSQIVPEHHRDFVQQESDCWRARFATGTHIVTFRTCEPPIFTSSRGSLFACSTSCWNASIRSSSGISFQGSQMGVMPPNIAPS